MSEESRLGREAIETAYALKQLVQAGVRVFFYLEDRERTLDSPTDKIMLSLTAFADELEREKARQRTYDAMQRKARAGHVTGGRVFGYDNVEILGADGQRSHVERRINDDGSRGRAPHLRAVRRRRGPDAHHEDAERRRAPAPRPQQGRPAAWAHELGPRGAAADRSTAARSSGTRRASVIAGGRPAAARPAGVRMAARGGAAAADRVRRAVARAAHAELRSARGAVRPSAVARIVSRGTCSSGFARCARLWRRVRRAHPDAWRRARATSTAARRTGNAGARSAPMAWWRRMEAIDAEVLATLQDDILRPAVVERRSPWRSRSCSPRGERGAHGGARARTRDACERSATRSAPRRSAGRAARCPRWTVSGGVRRDGRR